MLEREKLVLSLCYDQELNLREIGAVLEVTESRVCQIRSQAITRLRNQRWGFCCNALWLSMTGAALPHGLSCRRSCRRSA